MSRQEQRRPARTVRESGEQAAPAADLVNEQLAEDVACCLAEIDELLAPEESERDAAIREARALDKNSADYNKQLRLWQARYAHLGLSIVTSCCVTMLLDRNRPADDQFLEHLG